MSTIQAQIEPQQWAWLRNAPFDLTFVLGLPALAIATALMVSSQSSLLVSVVYLDLWLLGYHHVIATYTRLCFDKESFRASRPLIFGLLPPVAAGTFIVAALFGTWAVISIYFYWQWFHYTRQSWGIARAYKAKEPEAQYDGDKLETAIFYALPVLGIVARSCQNPDKFIGLDIKMIPCPRIAFIACAAVAIALLMIWGYGRIKAWRAGRLPTLHTLYMLSHFVIFAAGYILIPDTTIGWLAINIWHNAQYILFVWLFNTRRFKNGVDSKAAFLSYISQPGRLGLYLIVCLTITGIFYIGVLGALNTFLLAGLSGSILLYQTINFHHYVVDSLIWKLRKVPMKATLGLNS